MARTTTTVKTVEIVDLIRDRSSFPLLNVPKFGIKMKIEVTTSSMILAAPKVPSSKMDRLEQAARAKLDEYESIISKECQKFNKQIADLMKTGKPEALKEAQKIAQTVNVSVKNALLSAEAAAQQAVEARLKQEAQGDKLLTQARVKTAIKVTTGVISLASSITKLVVTSGADVTSYFSIAKTLLDLGLELKQQLKGEETLRKDLGAGVKSYLNLRSTAIMQAATRYGLTGSLPGFPGVISFIAKAAVNTGKETVKGKDVATIAKSVLDFTVKAVKAKYNDVETARQKYREHVTKMRHNVDGVSGKADALMGAMKKATTLKEGVQIGAECMKVKGQVRKLAEQLKGAEGYLDEMQTIMKGFGLACDDQTVLQKIKSLDKMTILSEGAGVASAIYGVFSLAKNIASAV